MKKITLLAVIAVAVLSIGAELTFYGTSLKTSWTQGTYADSQVDTLTWIRAGHESGATFWLQSRDSVNIVNVILRRQFNGSLLADLEGDTLLGASSDTVDAGALFQAPITLNPYTDTTLIFVTYEDSLNGVTSPTVRYGIGKKF